MDDDFQPGPSLSEKRRKYFAARDKYLAEKKGFRKLDVESGPQGPQFVMVLLCLLGVALVAFQILGPALYREEAEDITDIFPGDDPDSQNRSGIRLDPEPLQSYLIRLEVALFEPSSADSFESVVSDIALELDRFSEFLKASQDPGHQTFVTELESTMAPVRDESFDLESLSALQRGWIRLRSQSFQTTSWFRTPSRTERSPLPTYAVYRDIADQLLRQVGDGLSETEDVIEELSGIGTLESDQPARQDLLNRWTETAESWHDEIQALQSSLPERPSPNSPNALLDAIHRLDSALSESRSRLPSGRLPTAEDLASLEEALTRAQFAVEGFESLE